MCFNSMNNMSSGTALLIGTALTAATAVVGAYSNIDKQKQAQAQAQHQQVYYQQQHQAVAKARAEDAEAQQEQLTVRQTQINEDAQEAKTDRALEARKARARAIVAAGESGIGGITPSLVQDDIMNEAARDIVTIEKNRQRDMQQMEYHKGAVNRAGTTVGNAPYVGIPNVDYLGPAMGAGLQIGGALLDHKTAKSKLKDD